MGDVDEPQVDDRMKLERSTWLHKGKSWGVEHGVKNRKTPIEAVVIIPVKFFFFKSLQMHKK